MASYACFKFDIEIPALNVDRLIDHIKNNQESLCCEELLDDDIESWVSANVGDDIDVFFKKPSPLEALALAMQDGTSKGALRITGNSYGRWSETFEDVGRLLAPFATVGSFIHIYGTEDNNEVIYRFVNGKVAEDWSETVFSKELNLYKSAVVKLDKIRLSLLDHSTDESLRTVITNVLNTTEDLDGI